MGGKVELEWQRNTSWMFDDTEIAIAVLSGKERDSA